MNFLSPAQIDELLEIVDRYTLTFLAHQVGTDVLSQTDITRLSAAGVNTAQLTGATSNVTQAFKFGMLSDALGDAVASKMTFDQLKDHVATGRFIQFNEREKAALRSLKYQTYKDVNKLGTKIKNKVQDELVFADKKLNQVKHSKQVTDAAKLAIEERKGVQKMVSELGKSTGQWNKDLGRIAEYTLHQAFDEGRAMSFERKDGPNALVYKDVYPGACASCTRLYLTGGGGSAPKVFKLADLRANQTNIGRKQVDWLPVIGSTHPHCRCTLKNVPQGFTIADYKKGKWEWNGTDFVPLKDKWEPKVKKRSRAKVTIT